MQDKSTLELAQRLNAIIKDTNDLELAKLKIAKAEESLEAEWNAIVYELWRRIPSLQSDVDIQPKIRKKEKEGTSGN